jgi:hypothetical protein
MYAVASAVVATCIILYSLMAELSGWQSLVLLLGVLVVVWAIIFSFLEVRRIASRSQKITGPDEAVDPDAPRRVLVEPSTGDPCPHHENHNGSPGMDQGQFTSQLRGETPLIEFLQRRARKKHAD